MYLLHNRWLAWSLRLATDATLVAWLLLMAWVLVILVQQRSAGSDGGRQGSVYTELKLPPEIVRPASSDVTVVNFEASRVRIHYRTTRGSGPLEITRVVGAVIFVWGLFALILWQLRQILSTFVRREPLTLQNAHRFRLISVFMLLGAGFTALDHSIDYLRLQPLFPLLPPRGFLDLLVAHLEWSRLFAALLILLLAEVLRLGAEHRVDSEAVV